jgi:hypothetical protein
MMNREEGGLVRVQLQELGGTSPSTTSRGSRHDRSFTPLSFVLMLVWQKQGLKSPTCSFECVCMCMHAWMHVCMHGCMDVCVHGCMRACVRACMDAWMCACMDAWICVCVH